MCKMSFFLVRGVLGYISWWRGTWRPRYLKPNRHDQNGAVCGQADKLDQPALRSRETAPDYNILQLHMTNREGEASRSSIMGARQLKHTTATVIALRRYAGHDWGRVSRLQCRSVCGRIHLAT